MALVQIEKYERGPLGKLVLIAFVLFEGAMVLWFAAIVDGRYDPAPVPLNIRNPLGSFATQMAQIEARQNFGVGFIVVWALVTLIFIVLIRATRRRVFISEDR